MVTAQAFHPLFELLNKSIKSSLLRKLNLGLENKCCLPLLNCASAGICKTEFPRPLFLMSVENDTINMDKTKSHEMRRI